MLLQESNPAIQRDVPTSYMVKANFKPSEVSTVWLLTFYNLKNRTDNIGRVLFIFRIHTVRLPWGPKISAEWSPDPFFGCRARRPKKFCAEP